MKKYRAALGPMAVLALLLAVMKWSPLEPHRPPADPSGTPGGTVSWLDEDWTVFESAIVRAREARLDTLPMGELMAEIGRGLVGTAYLPQTLEVEGDERLVVNFRGFDCVTFVENVFALASAVRGDAVSRLADRGGVEGDYERVLRSLRYRDGLIDGYPSRLHYFSEWIADNERKLLLTDMTGELGGVLEAEAVDFMSTHADAYRQLSDPDDLEAIRQIEVGLSERGRMFLPADRIARAENEIRNGDIIAATSTVGGLDVAHTGIALWVEGTLRLMHAPLVGEAVQISEMSLSERIARIEGQDGIIVARPHEPGSATVESASTGGQ